MVKVQLKVGLKSSVWKSQAVGHLQLHNKLAVLTLMKALMVAVLCCHCSRLCCGYLRRLHNWNGDCWSFRYGEYVFTSCCGLCCFWKLKCGDLLICGDLSLAFFGLVQYFTEKLHCLIPESQKVSHLQVFNLRVEIVAE